MTEEEIFAAISEKSGLDFLKRFQSELAIDFGSIHARVAVATGVMEACVVYMKVCGIEQINIEILLDLLVEKTYK